MMPDVDNEKVLFMKPYSGAQQDVTMTASVVLNDTLTNKPIVFAVDFSIKNFIQKRLLPIDSLKCDRYSVLFHQDHNTVFHHRYWNSSENLEFAWEDLEFNSTGIYSQQQRDSFINQLEVSKAFALTTDYSIKNQFNTSQLFQEWWKDDQLYISLVYPIEVSEDWSIYWTSNAKKQVMLFARVFADNRGLLDAYKIQNDPIVQITYSLSILMIFLFLLIGSLHFAAILAHQLIIPIDSLIIFLQKNISSAILDKQLNSEQSSLNRYSQKTTTSQAKQAQDIVSRTKTKKKLKNTKKNDSVFKKNLNSSLDKNKQPHQTHRVSAGNSPFLQSKYQSNIHRSRSGSADVTFRQKSFTSLSFAHKLGVPITQRKNIIDLSSLRGNGNNTQFQTQRGSLSRFEEAKFFEIEDDPKDQMDTLAQQCYLTNLEQFKTFQGEKQDILMKKLSSKTTEQGSNYNNNQFQNNISTKEQFNNGGYIESIYTQGNSNLKDEQMSVQQQKQNKKKYSEFFQSQQHLQSQQQIQQLERQPIDNNLKKASLTSFKAESKNLLEDNYELPDADSSKSKKDPEELEGLERKENSRSMFSEVQVLWDTFYLLHDVISYKSESFDKSVGVAQSILHFSKASRTFQKLKNSYGQAISLLNLAHFQLVQEAANLRPQQTACCGFPSLREKCRGDSLGMETIECAQCLILSELGFESITQFEGYLNVGEVVWESEQEIVMLECFQTLLQMKGRYLRDSSMPCSKVHQLSIEDSNSLKIARGLLRLALRLYQIFNAKKQTPEYILLRLDILELNLTLNPRHFSRDLIFQRALIKASCLVDIQYLMPSSTHIVKKSEEDDGSFSVNHYQNLKFNQLLQQQKQQQSENHLKLYKDIRMEMQTTRRLISETIIEQGSERSNLLQSSSRQIKQRLTTQQKYHQPISQHSGQALQQWSSGIDARIQYLCSLVSSIQSHGNQKCLRQLTHIIEGSKYTETRILRRTIRAVSIIPQMYQFAWNLNFDMTRRLEQEYDILVVADCEDRQSLLSQLHFVFSSNFLWANDRIGVISFNQEEIRVAQSLVQGISERTWKATLEEVQRHIGYHNEKNNNNTITNQSFKRVTRQRHIAECASFPEEFFSFTEVNDEDEGNNNIHSQNEFENENLKKLKMTKELSIQAALEKALRLVPQLGHLNQDGDKIIERQSQERRVLLILLSSFSEMKDQKRINIRLSKLPIHTELLHLSMQTNNISSNQDIVISEQTLHKSTDLDSPDQKYQRFSTQEQLLSYLQSLRPTQYRPY